MTRKEKIYRLMLENPEELDADDRRREEGRTTATKKWRIKVKEIRDAWAKKRERRQEQKKKIACQKAIKKYTADIEAHPERASAYCNRGVAYQGVQEYKLAIADYTMAIEIAPQATDTYRNRALCYHELALREEHEKRRRKYYVRALEGYYYTVVKHNPFNLDDYLVLFRIYHDFFRRAGKYGDEEVQWVREVCNPIAERAFQLAKAQGDKVLYEKVTEAFDGPTYDRRGRRRAKGKARG